MLLTFQADSSAECVEEQGNIEDPRSVYTTHSATIPILLYQHVETLPATQVQGTFLFPSMAPRLSKLSIGAPSEHPSNSGL